MPVNVAVIPVAGRGTRLLPLTKSQPKEMLPLGRKPTVQHVVEELARSGVGEMLFITGPGKTAIENHFDIDDRVDRNLRDDGQRRAAGGIGLRAAADRVLLYPPTAPTRTWARRALCPSRLSASNRSWWPWAIRSSA